MKAIIHTETGKKLSRVVRGVSDLPMGEGSNGGRFSEGNVKISGDYVTVQFVKWEGEVSHWEEI